MEHKATDTSSKLDGSGTQELNDQAIQYYQGMRRLDLERLRENLECESPPTEDVAAMAQFLGILQDDSLFLKEACPRLLRVISQLDLVVSTISYHAVSHCRTCRVLDLFLLVRTLLQPSCAVQSSSRVCRSKDPSNPAHKEFACRSPSWHAQHPCLVDMSKLKVEKEDYCTGMQPSLVACYPNVPL